MGSAIDGTRADGAASWFLPINADGCPLGLQLLAVCTRLPRAEWSKNGLDLRFFASRHMGLGDAAGESGW